MGRGGWCWRRILIGRSPENVVNSVGSLQCPSLASTSPFTSMNERPWIFPCSWQETLPVFSPPSTSSLTNILCVNTISRNLITPITPLILTVITRCPRISGHASLLILIPIWLFEQQHILLPSSTPRKKMQFPPNEFFLAPFLIYYIFYLFDCPTSWPPPSTANPLPVHTLECKFCDGISIYLFVHGYFPSV